MRQVVKYIVAKTYKPLLVKYLSRTRSYRYKNIRLEIPPQVFHPGFFFSTKLLLKYISRLPLSNKSFLELGAGSGLIAIYARRMGAIVTASDINPIAVKALRNNAKINGVDLQVIHSDLFTNIPAQRFDIIAVNPPYYKRQPLNEAEYAWYCGVEGEYFQLFFKGLRQYIHPASQVLMILSDGCDLEMIQSVARLHLFRMNRVYTKQNLMERNTIYSIEMVESYQKNKTSFE